MSDIISQIWPEWRVEGLLGQGSYGKVYRAVRSGHGHTSYAAIKVIEIPQDPGEARDLASSGMDEASVRSYFEQRARSVLGEVEFMEELKGAPNIVGVEDYQLVELEGGARWAVLVRMPLLKPLKERFAEIGQPDARETARLGVDICRALTVCHTRGLIHRDVKPENIFFGPYGYLLGDFGIARRLGPDASSAHTRAGAFPYMAPEVFAGRSYGPNVDTYSLGLVLYRYLNNGRAPFLPTDGPFNPSDSDRAVTLRLAGRAIPAPKNADAALASIVLRATDPDPSKRFGSTAEMGAALDVWALGKMAATSATTAGSGPETVVLDPEQDSGTSRATASAAAAGAARAATPPSGSAQGPCGPSGTVRAYASPQARQTGYTGQPYGQPTSTPSGAAPAQGAAHRQASAPQNTTQGSPSGNRSGRTGAIIAIVVGTLLLLALLATMPFGCGGSSTVVETPPTSHSTSGSPTDDAVSPGGFLVDDDICTIQVGDIYIDDNGDLRCDYSATNHIDRTLSIYTLDDWTVNGSDVESTGITSVEPGQTQDDYIIIESETLPTTNIDEITSIEGALMARAESVYSYKATIPDTSEHSGNGFAGSRLVDNDICAVDVTNSYFDDSGNLRVDLSVANRTDEELFVCSDGVWMVNGKDAEADFDSNFTNPGETLSDGFSIESEYFSSTNIEEVESLSGPLTVHTISATTYDVSLSPKPGDSESGQSGSGNVESASEEQTASSNEAAESEQAASFETDYYTIALPDDLADAEMRYDEGNLGGELSVGETTAVMYHGQKIFDVACFSNDWGPQGDFGTVNLGSPSADSSFSVYVLVGRHEGETREEAVAQAQEYAQYVTLR